MSHLTHYAQAQPASSKPGEKPSPETNTLALSVVVPCYNEAENISHLCERLKKACAQAAGSSYEIILVDDGSSDQTRQRLAEIADYDPHMYAIILSRNYGHQLALTAGLTLSRGERTFILDADLQDPPELLSEMMSLMDEGYDVVYGQRSSRAGESRFKRASASLYYRLLEAISDTPIPVDSGDFRLISRRALDALLQMPEQNRYIRGMTSWIGFRQKAFPYHREARASGTSKYRLSKLLNLASAGITGFSTAPLRLAIYLGLGISLIAFLMIAYALVAWAMDATIPGWTSVFMAVLFLGGVQMVIMGILGEYIGHIYLEGKRRPLYVIDEIIGMEKREREPSRKQS